MNRDQFIQAVRNIYHRLIPKGPLQPHQRGRTHKRKPRRTRKRCNMSVRQYMRHFQRKDLWR